MGKKKGEDIDGWLVIDKGLHIGSTDIVNRTKRFFNARKVGHGGTLDPLASGILPVAFGQATKTIPYIMDSTKRYRFTLCMGESRTTDDREGDPVAISEIRPSDDELRACLHAFLGTTLQIPPRFSALKVNGQRAYDLARAGHEPILVPRPVRIDKITLVQRIDRDHVVFEVESGKGVYMRSLARDIAQKCGTLGHISALRRLKCGPFEEAHAITLDKLLQNDDKALALSTLLKPVSTGLADIPALAVADFEAKALRMGQSVDVSQRAELGPNMQEDTLLQVLEGASLVGLCRVTHNTLRPIRIFQSTNNGVDDVDNC